MPSKEEITELAYQRYKTNESYERSVWFLAYYTQKLKTNIKDLRNTINPLQAENLILLLKDDVNGSLIEPDENQVKKLAEQIYDEHPEKSKLNWFIAEKMLILKEIEELIRYNREKIDTPLH
ncbi:MAG: hypothetical protein EU547_04395 [Promethearchaeota archaeon]|nr:MAG: hypothetical protein EU547_04395 [Candidatus Lokiarchaeota archaeon]